MERASFFAVTLPGVSRPYFRALGVSCRPGTRTRRGGRRDRSSVVGKRGHMDQYF